MVKITALTEFDAYFPAVFPAFPPEAEELTALFNQHYPHFLTTFLIDESAANHDLSAMQWSAAETYAKLMASYQQEHYAEYPDKTPEAKPLESLWAQWYFGLLVPPMMLLLLQQSAPLDPHIRQFKVRFHESGRPEAFIYYPQLMAGDSRNSTPLQRMVSLVERHLIPAVNAIARQGVLNAKLMWSNIGYVMHWYLGELRPLLGDALFSQLEQALFFSASFPDGQDNPLYRTVLMRNGTIQRRTCCQRYKLPKMKECGDCPLTLG